MLDQMTSQFLRIHLVVTLKSVINFRELFIQKLSSVINYVMLSYYMLWSRVSLNTKLIGKTDVQTEIQKLSKRTYNPKLKI